MVYKIPTIGKKLPKGLVLNKGVYFIQLHQHLQRNHIAESSLHSVLCQSNMSRVKVKGLTRMGRQVSEDPDLDTLLSTLSPEEMEELQKDFNPEDGKIIIQGESQPRSNNVRDAKVDSRWGGDSRERLSQRDRPLEVSGFLM